MKNLDRSKDTLKIQPRHPEPPPIKELQQRLITIRIQKEEAQEKAQEKESLYQSEKNNHQQTLSLFDQEKARSSELQTQYSEAQAQLKFERRSKASIQAWGSRYKSENDKLKQEIAQMTVLLQESITKNKTAIQQLRILANRLTQIQKLINSVDPKAYKTPLDLLKKLYSVWGKLRQLVNEQGKPNA